MPWYPTTPPPPLPHPIHVHFWKSVPRRAGHPSKYWLRSMLLNFRNRTPQYLDTTLLYLIWNIVQISCDIYYRHVLSLFQISKYGLVVNKVLCLLKGTTHWEIHNFGRNTFFGGPFAHEFYISLRLALSRCARTTQDLRSMYIKFKCSLLRGPKNEFPPQQMDLPVCCTY